MKCHIQKKIFYFSCRVEHIIEKALSRKLSIEKSANLDDKAKTRLDDKATEPMHNVVILSSTKRREHSRREPILEEGSSMNETSSKVENRPSSRVSRWPLLSKHLSYP